MDTVKVRKEEVLAILKENRKKHQEEFIVASKAYRTKVADLLARELEKCVNGEKFSTYFQTLQPESHVKDYDLVIKMLEMTIDDIVEFDERQFSQLINDEWQWKSSFQSALISNSSYFGLSGITGPQGSAGPSGSSGIGGTSPSTKINITYPEDK